jgi:predicted Zn-dependent protease
VVTVSVPLWVHFECACGVAGLEDVLEQSFSLIGKPGTLSLHIVCSSKEECDFWYRGIQGLVAYQKASVEASIQVYQEAVDRNPSDVMCRVNLGLAMLRQDRTSDALAQLSRAAEVKSSSRRVLLA